MFVLFMFTTAVVSQWALWNVVFRYPATLVKSHSQDDLSHDFYSNVRYDTATGKAKLMRPVPW